MKKWVLYALGIVCVLAFFFPRPVFADELEDIAKKFVRDKSASKKDAKDVEEALRERDFGRLFVLTVACGCSPKNKRGIR